MERLPELWAAVYTPLAGAVIGSDKGLLAVED